MKKITFLIALFLSFSALSIQAQTITSFSPTSGLVGTTVTITGTGFSTIPANNIVQFNTIDALVTSATQTVLTVIVPEGATTGEIYVQRGKTGTVASSIFTVLETTSCNGLSNNNTKNWYFGNQAAMTFESSGPVALTNSAMTQVEGVATMSDSNGNLLFYTNGITIYNKNHQEMLNGSGLLSNSSNTQAAFVVPFPGNPNQYFVITPNPYYYSIVDMTLDNGNGAVVSTAKNILLTNEASEKIAGLLAANQRDIWLITYASGQMRFNVFKITPSGIDMTPVVSQFTTASGYYGYMKISPDGTKIGTANFDYNFHVYDFDAITGTVSNQKMVPYMFGGHGSYGIEFSPNSNLVYVADHRGPHQVVQFDITLATPALIAASATPLATNGQALGALQLGPDNKIYLAKESSSFLGVINNPNTIGTTCDFVSDGVNLAGKTSNLGLPGFVASSLVRNEPYISSFSPISGEVGDAVIISGINFNTTPSNNFVSFNGIPAIVTAASETSLTVIVPNGATTGKISVAVGCGLVTGAEDFTIEELGINDVSKTKIAVFPNPSSGIFNIQSHQSIENVTISIADMNGRIVYQSKSENLNGKQLDLNNLQTGIYILSIKNNTFSHSQKLIKQ